MKHITNEKKLTRDNKHNCYIFEVRKPIVINKETDTTVLIAISESYLFNFNFNFVALKVYIVKNKQHN